MRRRRSRARRRARSRGPRNRAPFFGARTQRPGWLVSLRSAFAAVHFTLGPAVPFRCGAPLRFSVTVDDLLQHVRELFGDQVASLDLERREYVERSPGGPGDYREFFKATFGPVVAVYASLADRPEQSAALDREFLDFATRSNEGEPGAPAEYRYEYLLVVARKRGR
jgi:hypothetical protein